MRLLRHVRVLQNLRTIIFFYKTRRTISFPTKIPRPSPQRYIFHIDLLFALYSPSRAPGPGVEKSRKSYRSQRGPRSAGKTSPARASERASGAGICTKRRSGGGGWARIVTIFPSRVLTEIRTQGRGRGPDAVFRSATRLAVTGCAREACERVAAARYRVRSFDGLAAIELAHNESPN